MLGRHFPVFLVIFSLKRGFPSTVLGLFCGNLHMGISKENVILAISCKLGGSGMGICDIFWVNLLIVYAWKTLCCVFGKFCLKTRLSEHGVRAVLCNRHMGISKENVILAISCKVGGSGMGL